MSKVMTTLLLMHSAGCLTCQRGQSRHQGNTGPFKLLRPSLVYCAESVGDDPDMSALFRQAFQQLSALSLESPTAPQATDLPTAQVPLALPVLSSPVSTPRCGSPPIASSAAAATAPVEQSSPYFVQEAPPPRPCPRPPSRPPPPRPPPGPPPPLPPPRPPPVIWPVPPPPPPPPCGPRDGPPPGFVWLTRAATRARGRARGANEASGGEPASADRRGGERASASERDIGGRQGQAEDSERDASQGTEEPGDPSRLLSDQDAHLHEYEVLYDKLFERIRDALRTNPETATQELRIALGLTERNDLLWKGHKLYVPADDSLRRDILYWHHDVPWCAHLGVRKTVELVKRDFYWPKMDFDIQQYVTTCTQCQMNKTDRRNR